MSDKLSASNRITLVVLGLASLTPVVGLCCVLMGISIDAVGYAVGRFIIVACAVLLTIMGLWALAAAIRGRD